MGVKVAKFGGTSLANCVQLSKVKNIIKQDKDRKYIVVSAPGKRNAFDDKITDMLYKLYDCMSTGVSYSKIFENIITRYMSIKMNLDLKVNLLKEFDSIKSNIINGAGRDYIISRGEYLNALLVADFLNYKFVDAEDLICFDNRGKLMLDKTYSSVYKALRKLDNAVIPGFYGKSLDGRLVTFQRGGSDITGALVSRAIDADLYENWTDVSGFMSADPRIVSKPKAIDNLTYAEFYELASMGAEVLHIDSIYPAKEKNIPINIRNTNMPESVGTLINKEKKYVLDDVIGIAGKKQSCDEKTNLSKIKIVGGKQLHYSNFLSLLFNILAINKINVKMIEQNIDANSLVIGVNSEHFEKTIRCLYNKLIERRQPHEETNNYQ